MSEADRIVSLEQAFEMIAKHISRLDLPSETVAAADAMGKSIVEDQVSVLDLPGFNKSAMDGYAVLEGDERDEYDLLEMVAAGQVPTKKLTPGACTKIMTGAPVPDGAGKVIMVEKTSEEGGKVRVLSHAGSNNICPQGEDVRRGDVILRAPMVLGALQIANLVSAGITEVKVSRRIRASVISTGDEIVDSADELGPGKIMNSNGPLLAGLCAEHGLDVVSNVSVADDLDATTAALRDALDAADIVLLSGGVSAGDLDFVPEAMKRAGIEMHFDRLAVKPGRPMTFGSHEGRAVFGFPGNPVAVYLMFGLLALRTAGLMMGRKCPIRFIKLKLASDYRRKKSDRLGFLPCRLGADGTIEPAEYHGTAHLRSLLDSDGFFAVPKGVNELSAGQTVDFVTFRGSF